VCGIKKENNNYIVTPTGHGHVEFNNFEEAKKAIPDLDPDINGKRFTNVMFDGDKMRFET